MSPACAWATTAGGCFLGLPLLPFAGSSYARCALTASASRSSSPAADRASSPEKPSLASTFAYGTGLRPAGSAKAIAAAASLCSTVPHFGSPARWHFAQKSAACSRFAPHCVNSPWLYVSAVHRAASAATKGIGGVLGCGSRARGACLRFSLAPSCRCSSASLSEKPNFSAHSLTTSNISSSMAAFSDLLIAVLMLMEKLVEVIV